MIFLIETFSFKNIADKTKMNTYPELSNTGANDNGICLYNKVEIMVHKKNKLYAIIILELKYSSILFSYVICDDFFKII